MTITRTQIIASLNLFSATALIILPIAIQTSLYPQLLRVYGQLLGQAPTDGQINLYFMVIFLLASLNIYYSYRVFTQPTTATIIKAAATLILSSIGLISLVALANATQIL